MPTARAWSCGALIVERLREIDCGSLQERSIGMHPG